MKIIESYPFTSQVTYNEFGEPLYDRAVDAEFMRKFYMVERSNGVIKKNNVNSFLVNQNTPAGMKVIVEPGKCFIQGAYGLCDEQTEIDIAGAHPTLKRIDTIVARLDVRIEARCISIDVLTGTPSSSPVSPTLTQNDEVWEIPLADVLVDEASPTITSSQITDMRSESTPAGSGLSIETAFELSYPKFKIVPFYESQLVLPDGRTASGPAEFFYKAFGISSNWKKLPDGYVLRTGSDHSTGGSDTHVLTVAQMPEHWHNGRFPKAGFQSGLVYPVLGINPQFVDGVSVSPLFGDDSSSIGRLTLNEGSSGSHNNIPKYQNIVTYYRY